MPKQAILNERTVLKAALEGLELKRARLDEQIAVIHSVLGKRKRGRPRRHAAADSAELRPTVLAIHHGPCFTTESFSVQSSKG